jgi:hypothetical protein
MIATWTDAELDAADAVAREAIRTLRGASFAFDRTVTKPSFFGGDALEPLLAQGWQAPDEEESAVWGDESGQAGDDR